MQLLTLVVGTLALIPSSWAAPTTLSQLTITQAGGDVPQGAPPLKLSSSGIANFQLANFIENVESAFFEGALTTLANDPAFTASVAGSISIKDVIIKVAAQEEVHKATIEGALTSNKAALIPPCTSVESVPDTKTLLARANIITSTSIGAIISLDESLAISDPQAVGSASSILPVEARHDAFFRLSAGDVPNPSPFDTGISGIWAFNIMLTFVNPSSCPTLPNFKVLPPLNITSPALSASTPAVRPSTIAFTFNPKLVPASKNMFVGWVNQANAPVYTPANVLNGVGTTSVPPGLTGTAFIALTNQNTAATVDDLTTATLAGPAAILLS